MNAASDSVRGVAGGPEDRPLRYRLVTGVDDDATFCERISSLLDQGYRHGSPTVTFNTTDVIAAQALIWGGA